MVASFLISWRLRLLLISTCLFSSLQSSSQRKSESAKARAENKATMKSQVMQLKNGVLLVRLSTKQNSIDALRKKGSENAATALEKKQYAYNLSLVKAFRGWYTFSPVYFFFSSYSDELMNKNFSSVVFLNDSLQPDTAIHISNDQFLMAEFGNVQQDTAGTYKSKTDTVQTIVPKTTSTAGTDFGFRALIVRSNAFVQLKSPFPYYIKQTRLLPFLVKKPAEMVAELNLKLNDYYKEVTRTPKRKKK